jgi:signal transduction histidine kinase
VGEAITTYLTRDEQAPDPHALARVIGEAAGATGCALVIATHRWQWGDGVSWVEHDLGNGDVLAIAPASAGALPGVAAMVGAPVAAIRLSWETDRLRRELDAATHALADDRWRAAAEMEGERRGLEQNLHDGAQHHLVALRMSLALVEHALSTGAGRERVAELLARLDNAERVLLDTAAGILPAELVAHGLAAALGTELARHATVTLDVSRLRRRYPSPVESAVYYVVLEAVNNARKYAGGAPVRVLVWDSYQGLEFAVTDDGPGFEMAAPGTGLPNLTARAASVGGTVQVRSAPGGGTTVTGFVPL